MPFALKTMLTGNLWTPRCLSLCLGGFQGEPARRTPGKSFIASNHPAKKKFERPNYLEEEAKAAAQKVACKEEKPIVGSVMLDKAAPTVGRLAGILFLQYWKQNAASL